MANVLASTAEMSRDKWLEARRKGIGGSDVAVIFGLSKYKSPIGLWLDKTGQVEPEEAGEAAYWGTILEPVVAQEFTKLTGLKVRRRNAILQHPEHPFMLANVDRFVDKQKAGLECKTASEYLKDQWEYDNVPDAYYLQCHHYMAVTGYSSWYIAVLIGGNKFKWAKIERNEQVIQRIIEGEAEFWKYVETMTSPPANGSPACSDELKSLYPVSDGSEINLGSEAEILIRAYELAEQDEKEAKARKDLAKNQLCEMLGQAEKGRCGERIVVWSTVKGRTTVDSKTLKSKFPDIYSQVAKPGASTRRFSLK